MNNDEIQSVIDVVRACPDVQLCTIRMDGYPETRHVMNAMNNDVSTLELHFLTGCDTPKLKQIIQNPKCCLYYFNPENRHAVRLFGEIAPVTDMAIRREYWRDDYKQFGYTGADDPEYTLLKFTPKLYKFYDSDGLKSGML